MALKRGGLGPVYTFAPAAPPLLDNGYVPLAITPRTKRADSRWADRSSSWRLAAVIASECASKPDHGVAIICGSIVVLDSDEIDRKRALAAYRVIRRIVPGMPPVRIGAWPKFALVFRTDEQIKTRHYDKLDVLGTGSYVMGFGIHPDTSQPYRWLGASPLDTPRDDLPLITNEQIERIVKALGKVKASSTPPAPAAPAVAGPPATVPPVASGTIDQLIMDGRDTFLTDIVFQAWSDGFQTLEALTRESWDRFARAAELTRPKRGGTHPWSEADARYKAKKLLAKAARGDIQRSARPVGKLTYDPKLAPFVHAVDALTTRRLLPPAAAKLSQLMCCFCTGPQGCFVSAEKLADHLGLAFGTVKRMRSRLVELGLWVRKRRGGGRGNMTYLLPRPEIAIPWAEKVTDMGTWSPRVEEEAPEWSPPSPTFDPIFLEYIIGPESPDYRPDWGDA